MIQSGKEFLIELTFKNDRDFLMTFDKRMFPNYRLNSRRICLLDDTNGFLIQSNVNKTDFMILGHPKCLTLTDTFE